jgi:DNA polymerase III subunit beta
MKLIFDRNVIQQAVQAVAEVAPSRATRPIAQGMLFEVTEERVEVAATDYDVGIRYTLEPKEKEGQGRVVVNASQMLSVIRDLPNKDVELNLGEELVKIKCGGSRMSLPVMDERDFPEINGVGSDQVITLPAKEIAEMFDRVSYAAGQEESRYAINGVFVKLNKKDLEVVATDARRLAISCKKLAKDTKMSRNAILPLKLVGMLKKLSAGEKEIAMVLRDNEVVLVCGKAVLVGRLVEGSYPKYQEAIPKDNDKTVIIDKATLKQALKQAMNFTVEETRAVTLCFSKGQVTIGASVAERGEANIVVETDYKGEEFEVAFNGQYLADAIGRLQGSKVEMQLSDGSRPGLICEGKEYTSVVMPVRLPGE